MAISPDFQIQRARLLLEQHRYKDAEKELQQALAADPNNNEAMALLARIKIDTKQAVEGLQLLDQALSISPEEDYYLYLKAFAYYQLNQPQQATASLDIAIAMNPWHPGYFALYAFILIHSRSFEQALQKANAGLAIDASDIGCLNARSQALNKLNQTQAAIDTMQDALSVDPENDFSHTTVAFNYLEKGKHQKAAGHFREALRINPANQQARVGMKEALKSKIPPYRWLLQYEFWLQNKGKNMALFAIIGLYILYRLVLFVSTKVGPPWSYMLITIAISYLALVIISWLIAPLANFFLLFHHEGKYALTSEEKWVSISVVSLLGLALAFFVSSLLLADPLKEYFELTALVLATYCLPVQRIQLPVLSFSHGFAHNAALVLAVLGILALCLLFLNIPLGGMLITGYLMLWLVSTWITAFSSARKIA